MAKRAVLFFGSFFILPFCAVAADWTLRLEGGATTYSRNSGSAYSLGYSELTLDGGYSLSLACEYHLNSLVGFEASIARIALDAEWREFRIEGVGDPPHPEAVLFASDSGEFALQPIGLAAIFHVLRAPRSDLHIGPQIAWVTYDIALEGSPHRKSEAAFGVKVGWDWRPTESPWSVGLSYQYLDVQHEGVEHDPYTGLPLQVAALGLSYRFEDSHASE